ncbi:MAG: transcriptional activator FtrB [Smithella sp. PtaU1.Bin162]|jgi:CRP-like cAMP-binding protein|nr:MAG: transcriptional activator FtrB [Smithella sp. PtaU1.Bin162]
MIPFNELKKFSFLEDFSDAQLNKLAAIAIEEQYPAGTQMYQKGDNARGLFLIKEGKIVLFMDKCMGPQKPPMQVTVDMISQGEAMGWSAVVDPYLYTLSALCIDDVELISLDAFALRQFMDEDCALGFKIMQAVAKTIATRLTHTRIILVGERGLSTVTEY